MAGAEPQPGGNGAEEDADDEPGFGLRHQTAGARIAPGGEQKEQRAENGKDQARIDAWHHDTHAQPLGRFGHGSAQDQDWQTGLVRGGQVAGVANRSRNTQTRQGGGRY